MAKNIKVYSDMEQNWITTRTLSIMNDISSETFEDFLPKLDILNHTGKEPIRIFMNSFGGEVYSGLGFYDAMTLSKSPIHTYAMGLVASSSILPFLAGEKRYASPNAFFMIHEVTVEVKENARNLGLEAEHTKVLQEKWTSIMRERTQIPESIIEEYTKNTVYIDAQTAKTYGIITDIMKR